MYVLLVRECSFACVVVVCLPAGVVVCSFVWLFVCLCACLFVCLVARVV